MDYSALNWQAFRNLPEIKDLPLLEQKQRFLAIQNNVNLLLEGRAQQQLMMFMMSMAASGGFVPEVIDETKGPDIELLTESLEFIMTQADDYIIAEQN